MRPPAGTVHSPTRYSALLDAALRRRAALLGDGQTDAVRLFHDTADGTPGFVLEKFGPVLIAQFHSGRFTGDEAALREALRPVLSQTGCTAAYRKEFAADRAAAAAALDKAHRDAAPWLGAATPSLITIREYAARFVIRPYDGFSVGLFLEQRENRRRVTLAGRGRRVLNCFAYTCSFSVAAALGGAAETVSVDVSKRYLAWGRENFAAAGVPLDGHWFICSDVQDYFRRAARQGRLFDLIVLDPPTFGRIKETGRVFSIAQDLDRLVAGAIDRLAPGGELLLATNHRDTTLRRLEEAARRAAQQRRIIRVEPLPPPADFAGDADYSKAVWVRME